MIHDVINFILFYLKYERKFLYSTFFISSFYMDALKIYLFDSHEDECVYLMQEHFFFDII